LGLAPGPQVGRALDHLTELRLDQGPLDEATAKAELHAWAARQR
jgi:poly(A) polymerase